MLEIQGMKYSEIPLLRPPKIETFYPLKTLFAKFRLFFSSFSTPSVSLIKDHLLDCPKGGLNIGILLYSKFIFLMTTSKCEIFAEFQRKAAKDTFYFFKTSNLNNP